jgi:hypothetical protein
MQRGFELGNSDYRNMLTGMGMLNLLDAIYVTAKNKEI